MNSEIIDLTAKYEKELADKDASWKIRMDVAVNTLTVALRAKESELGERGKALGKLGRESQQHLEVLEAAKKPLSDQVVQLKGVVADRDESIKDLQKTHQTDLAALEELQRKEAQWKQEKPEYLAKMRGFQTDNARLQNEISRLQADVARLQIDRTSSMEDSARQIQSEKKQAQEARKMVESEFKQQEARLLQELKALKDSVAEGEKKMQELERQDKGKEDSHALALEAARREEKAKADERVAEAKKRLREDLESVFDRREQNSKSLAESQKEHELGRLRRELEREIDNERHSRTVLEKKLEALKDQHKREAELVEVQTSGDRERAERKHATELMQKKEEARQKLEQVRMEREETERQLK